ncbi:catalase [Marinobacter sp. LV10R520-4]|uniref:catalase n=1 Tax=Marinobacter sp. LV10R520-4 TaxID=1761796 RepID=UPI000BFA352D|nr:catalase [Marinobacter sp. LV10R520-4]PFG51586.1 catalase [Marinobacter sp. LV10R520-4]
MSKPKKPSQYTPGQGGELHQHANATHPTMTTQQGAPVADDQNSLRAGARGPGLLEDHVMREKIFHFDHERIPERVVHARGVGFHGYFENYSNQSELTAADLFQRPGEQTPVFTRFSTVAGNKGSADLPRDVRGFAVKFYTQKGNWDLVGNNMPVFFIQDAMKFPDLVHAVKEAPDRGFPQAQSAHDNFWDFVSLMPESTHMLMWTMSDRAIPRSPRFMEGFGVHSFRFVNAEGDSKFVKFHWKPKRGMQSVVWNEALKINGADPDFHRRDMWDAIQRGDYPEWELGVQIFDDAFAEEFEFDILDATKLIPEEQVPITPLGKMVLNRVVDNFFAETEQVAFCTQNIVRGIDHSNDPLLQGRNFSYLDTQTKRLGGPNFTHIPINAPKCPMHHFLQDGHMAMTNPTGRANYEPNSWEDSPGPRENPAEGFHSYPEEIEGTKVRERSPTFADHYSQAFQFYTSQTDVEQKHIVAAFVFELSKVEREDIRLRMIAHLLNVDESLAEKVAEGLGLDTLPKAAEPAMKPRKDLPVSDALSILKNGPNSFGGRKLGVFVSEGTNAETFDALKAAVESQNAVLAVIAPTIGGVTDSNGRKIAANEKIDGGPSVLFDAIALLPGADGIDELAGKPPVRDFISDALAHCKFIGFDDNGEQLISSAGFGTRLDDGCIKLDADKAEKACTKFIESCAALRYWDRE